MELVVFLIVMIKTGSVLAGIAAALVMWIIIEALFAE